jgi:hypothetical protein
MHNPPVNLAFGVQSRQSYWACHAKNQKAPLIGKRKEREETTANKDSFIPADEQ